MRLRQVLILSRDLSRSTQFFQEGLGLKLLRSSDTFAEFDIKAGVPLCIKLAQKYAAFVVNVFAALLFVFRDRRTTITLARIWFKLNSRAAVALLLMLLCACATL